MTRSALTVRTALLLMLAPLSCGVELPMANSTDEELSRGLIVLYPGASSVPYELLVWPNTLRDAGFDEAIQVRPWAVPWENLRNHTDLERNLASAQVEADRIAAYLESYPGRDVTLVGYSGGASFVPWVAERLPDGMKLRRIIMLSSGLSPGYDLTRALDHTELGGLNYYSTVDVGSAELTTGIGTSDGIVTEPAAYLGFESTDPRLKQVNWDPTMLFYGNGGGHFDYLINPNWIYNYLPDWIRGTDLVVAD